jgi:hypothetical protein
MLFDWIFYRSNKAAKNKASKTPDAKLLKMRSGFVLK